MQSLNLGDPKNRLKIIGNQNWDILNSSLEVEANLFVISYPASSPLPVPSLILHYFYIFFFFFKLPSCLLSMLIVGPNYFPISLVAEQGRKLSSPNPHAISSPSVAFCGCLFVCGCLLECSKIHKQFCKIFHNKNPFGFLVLFFLE